MKPKHTPGPWKIEGSGPGATTVVPSGIRGDACAIIARVFASFAKGGPDIYDLPQEANARLIAEAPALLATLKKVQARLCEHCPQYVDSGEQVGDHTDECIEAQDLIAKAEGK